MLGNRTYRTYRAYRAYRAYALMNRKISHWRFEMTVGKAED